MILGFWGFSILQVFTLAALSLQQAIPCPPSSIPLCLWFWDAARRGGLPRWCCWYCAGDSLTNIEQGVKLLPTRNTYFLPNIMTKLCKQYNSCIINLTDVLSNVYTTQCQLQSFIFRSLTSSMFHVSGSSMFVALRAQSQSPGATSLRPANSSLVDVASQVWSWPPTNYPSGCSGDKPSLIQLPYTTSNSCLSLSFEVRRSGGVCLIQLFVVESMISWSNMKDEKHHQHSWLKASYNSIITSQTFPAHLAPTESIAAFSLPRHCHVDRSSDRHER